MMLTCWLGQLRREVERLLPHLQEMKEREIQDLINEHERIVEHVENEWRGEAEEARGQVDELRDVSAITIFVWCAH